MKGTYDKFPVVAVPDSADACAVGWEACAERLRRQIARRNSPRTVLAVECYPGVDEQDVLRQLQRRLVPTLALKAAEALLPPSRIDELTAPFLGGDDPVFGFLSGLDLPQFFDPDRLAHLRHQIASIREGLVLIVGCGARLVAEGDILVYADLARWEAQNRFRRNEISNLGVENRQLPASAAIQACLLRGLAGGRPLEARVDRQMGLCPRHQRPVRAEAGRGRRGPARTESRRDAPLSRRAVFRSCPLGRALDGGGLRPRRRCAQLRLVLRLRSGGEQPAVRIRRTLAWSFQPSTWCSISRAHCWARPCTPALAMNFPSASTFSIRWAAAICPSRCIR